MQPKKTAKYECHYPLVAEDSAYHYTNCNWQYGDSLRTYHAKYKDSVAVDYDVSEMRYIYVHRDNADSWKGRQEDKQDITFATTAQYYMVPAFFALMMILMIFAFVLYRDNDKALRQKRKDSVLGFISKEKDDIYTK